MTGIPYKTPQELECENFNGLYNVGDIVIVKGDHGEEFEDEIKYPATVMGGHTAVTWLKGKGSYMLNRVMGKKR